MDENDLLYFNGVNGATGDYGLPPMSADDMTAFIRGEARPENLDELIYRHQQRDMQHLGVKEGVDPKDLAQAGWGIIFAHGADPAIKEALTDLIKLRQAQAGPYFRLYEGGDGFRPNDNKRTFLARHGAGPGPADPDKVPYYLLIVGGPEDISYQAQYQLDVQYVVGRIAFDTLDEYERYAKSVVSAETGQLKLAREFSMFSVSNASDRATNLSHQHLMQPLYDYFKKDQPEWKVNLFGEEAATKAQLARLLGGDQTPALLFTTSHGVEFPLGDQRQIPHQGALLCQDWPGPYQWRGEIPQDFYFAGDDLSSDARLAGLIAFCFACYGAGTPLLDEFSRRAFAAQGQRSQIAPHPFIANLPAKMLSHPQGGALAAIGHVERAWGYSFLWPGAGAQTAVFESTLKRLLEGHPVGSAVEFFDERYAELSSDLSVELEEIEFGKEANPYDMVGLWTANNDARSYVILGDPAVRLPIADSEETVQERPVIEVVNSQFAGRRPVSSKRQAEASKPAVPETTSAPVSMQAQTAVDQADAAVEFGLRSTASDITGSMRDVAARLGDVLRSAADDLSSLEVMTYTSGDIGNAHYDPRSRTFSGDARLRAMTRIALDGDQINLVPERKVASLYGDEDKTEVAIDEQLWAIHREMVGLAQENRIQFFKAMAEVVASLVRV